MSTETPPVSADSAVLTREQGDALAAEVLAVIPDLQGHPPTSVVESQWERDRLRITADLVALHRAHDGITDHVSDSFFAGIDASGRALCSVKEHDYWPCLDARRYAKFAQAATDALWRTAKPYGIYP